jgi:hypothetical protein
VGPGTDKMFLFSVPGSFLLSVPTLKMKRIILNEDNYLHIGAFYFENRGCTYWPGPGTFLVSGDIPRLPRDKCKL